MKLYAEIIEAIKKKPLHNPPHKIIYTLSAKDRRGTFEKYTGHLHTRGVKTNKLYYKLLFCVLRLV